MHACFTKNVTICLAQDMTRKIRALLLNSAVGLCVGCVLLDLTSIHINTSKYELVLVLMFVLVLVFLPVSMPVIVPLRVLVSVFNTGFNIS